MRVEFVVIVPIGEDEVEDMRKHHSAFAPGFVELAEMVGAWERDADVVAGWPVGYALRVIATRVA